MEAGMKSMLRRLPIVAVFGQGTPIDDNLARLAREAGALVARLPAHLLTGGGYGVMEAASEGFVAVPERAGFCIGIISCRSTGPFDQPHRDNDGRPYPNRFVEISIMTPLPPRVSDWRTTPGRNHVNVLSADAIIHCPATAEPATSSTCRPNISANASGRARSAAWRCSGQSSGSRRSTVRCSCIRRRSMRPRRMCGGC
jgi:hypothetical protein